MTGVITIQGRLCMAYSQKSTRDYGYPTHLAVGSGTTAASINDTTLQSETAEGKVALTSVTVSEANRTIIFTGTVTFSGSRTVTEYGLFAKQNGTYKLCIREVRAPIQYSSGEGATFSFTYTW